MDDGELLARAEEALTEIKVNQGLSEPHEAVLAALRIRLRGSATGSLEQMLQAAEDGPSDSLEAKLAEPELSSERSLDELLQEEPKKPEWPS